MSCLRVHVCHLSSEGPRVLRAALNSLTEIHMNGTDSLEYNQALETVVSCVYKYATIPIGISNSYSTPVNKKYSLKQVGSRYLLYRAEDDKHGEFPTLVILRMYKTETNHIHVFHCTWDPCVEYQTSGSVSIGATLSDINTSNMVILRSLQPFLGAPDPTDVTRSWCPSSIDATTVCATVCIPQPGGLIETLQVTPTGLQCIRHALRGQGGLSSPNVHNVIIAQDANHTLRVLIGRGAFKMQLYKTEDIFVPSYSENNTATPALVQLSHHFHPMDQLVEETAKPLLLTGLGDGLRGVTGMLATAQIIMRRNVSATPLRSLGSNRTTALYSGMSPCEITRVLQAMRLVTDNPHVATSLNRICTNKCHKNTVVTRVSEVDLICGELAGLAGDVRLHQCGAQSYAIAHQNAPITCFLNRNIGLNMAEISTALYSGIAFCHACAYDACPTITNKQEMRMNLINVSDFTADHIDAVHAYVKEDNLYQKIPPLQSVGVSFNYTPSWSSLRHNFHVSDDTSENHKPIRIECIASASGLVYFRREHDDFVLNDNDPELFVGAVYVPPTLNLQYIQNSISNLSNKQQVVKTAVKAKSLPKYRSSLPNIASHALVPIVSQLAVQNPSSRIVFLQNATETLFHLNSMCLNNPVTKFGKPFNHQMLRKAWLHTHMLRAARLCGGVHKSDYYALFAHLSNKAAQPLDRVDYWANIPYV